MRFLLLYAIVLLSSCSEQQRLQQKLAAVKQQNEQLQLQVKSVEEEAHAANQKRLTLMDQSPQLPARTGPEDYAEQLKEEVARIEATVSSMEKQAEKSAAKLQSWRDQFENKPL